MINVLYKTIFRPNDEKGSDIESNLFELIFNLRHD